MSCFNHPFEDYTFKCKKCGGKVVYDPEEFCHICTKCRSAYFVSELDEDEDEDEDN